MSGADSGSVVGAVPAMSADTQTIDCAYVGLSATSCEAFENWALDASSLTER
ncbi:MAG TPA: hypothetical protein VFA81_02965 [Burkholderiales bacterium]|nr:hypothetical protein [Burkholderiales bacterium]